MSPRRESVGTARRRAVKTLDAAVAKELPPLKLEKARFSTVIDGAGRDRLGRAWRRARPFRGRDQSRRGGRAARQDRVGRRAGALHAGAQGGAGAQTSAVPTLVFDEVDSGIGGAAAAAVGERLHRLAQGAAGAGGDAFAAGGGARHASLAGREDGKAGAPPRRGSTSSTTRSGARRSRACCRARRSPPRRAPPPRA